MARSRLIIVGGGDYAREFLWVARDIPEDQRDWSIAGCLDDDVDGARARMSRDAAGVEVLGTIGDHNPRPDERFICSIANPRVKLALCSSLASRGAEFTNLVHPTAAVAPDARLGLGIFLYRGAMISVGAIIGDHVSLNMYATIGHDAVIGDGCTINSHSDITGYARLGRGVYVGSHGVVLPKATVGAFALVGAGSVVIRSVSPETSVLGVPARRL